MTHRSKPILLFFLTLALFPAIAIVVRVVGAGTAGLAVWEWLLLLASPLLVWLWFRHFSVLGCRDACRLPEDP